MNKLFLALILWCGTASAGPATEQADAGAAASGAIEVMHAFLAAAAGERISTYDSLYVVEHSDGRWGVRARSSFAP